MRVLHFTEIFSPLTETFIYDYVTELERQGTDNHVLTLRRENREERPFPKVTAVKRAGRWHPLRLGMRVLAAAGAGSALESSWPVVRPRLARAVRDVAPDVIHAHFGPAATLIAPVAGRLGIPLVATFYGYDISRLALDDAWVRRYARLWSTVGGVTVLSETMRRQAIRLGCPADRLRVVHLARDLRHVAYRPPPRTVRHFLSVGRLVGKKGHADAIRAIRQVHDAGSTDVRLDIVGAGPLHAELHALITASGLEDSVVLKGAMSSNDVLRAMQDADALLLCSKTDASGNEEGTPTVLVEAQSLGLPCVATDHAGVAEMLPAPARRFMAPAGDVTAIADAIQRLASCPVEELGRIARAGRDRMEEQFDISTECAKLRSLYDDVGSGRAHTAPPALHREPIEP